MDWRYDSPSMTAFADRLLEAIRAKGTPTMVGLDPRLDHLPEPFRSQAQGSASDAATALRDFHRELLATIAPMIPVVKPQAAFFERLGHAGVAALEDAVATAKELGMLVVMDAKRGDIGSTATAYADAWLGGGHGQCMPASDALTVNPYLGEDACSPFLEAADQHDAGLFLLVKTSNPGAGLFQDHGEPPLADQVAEAVAGWGASRIGACGWSSIGAVVGATRPSELAHFRRLMPHTLLLLPGFGFQGGTAEGLAPAFDDKGEGAVINASRSILHAHEREDLAGLPDWQSRTAAAVEEMREQLSSIMPATS